MDNVSSLVLLTIGFVAFIASIPQLLKILKIKNSDQLSATSWIIFFLYQLSSLVYAITINSITYIILNVMWVSFYGLMLVLIFKYRHKL